ncbi:MAG TPA: DUF2062 domain-containing protein [Thermoanaerobaculia bacterium]|jgi:hypothetical protein|nr:DUF2062 domain-containing protein [Thermoanaerobaculia bacterium]
MRFPIPRAFRRRRKHPLKLSRRGKVLLLDLLGREEPPERVAAALALGIGIGFSPFVGVHFVLAIGLAFLFRVNRIDAILGSLAGNPWTLPPVYAAGYALGRQLLRYDRSRVPDLPWDRLLHRDFWHAFSGAALHPRLLSFLVGTTVLAVMIGLSAYLVLRTLLRLYHRRHPKVAQRAARLRERASRRKRRRDVRGAQADET